MLLILDLLDRHASCPPPSAYYKGHRNVYTYRTCMGDIFSKCTSNSILKNPHMKKAAYNTKWKSAIKKLCIKVKYQCTNGCCASIPNNMPKVQSWKNPHNKELYIQYESHPFKYNKSSYVYVLSLVYRNFGARYLICKMGFNAH